MPVCGHLNYHGIKGLSVKDLFGKILLQDHAGRLVDIAAADQELLMAAFANGAQHLLVRIVGIDPVDIDARRHEPFSG
jgi:hypothetical protein